jgi:tetratricopeptide (TPR) repeat protein
MLRKSARYLLAPIVLASSVVAQARAELPCSAIESPQQIDHRPIAGANAPVPQTAATSQPEFYDEPHFVVAGVTDTTDLGGHGSDTLVRNRELVTAETASLGKQLEANGESDSNTAANEKSLRDAVARSPENFNVNLGLGKLLLQKSKPKEALPYLQKAVQLNDAEPAQQSKSSEQSAEVHHLLAYAEELSGDSLGAVKEYQRSAELNPTESYVFDWGSELLIHHAPEPAIEVFAKGNRIFPHSIRMLEGLGAAWYARGSYVEAAQHFCEASDLNPGDPIPYLLMGKIQEDETTTSPVIDQRLARFVTLQPKSAWGNYYYAISVQKQRHSLDDVQTRDRVISLLQLVVQLDPNLGLAYVELGKIYSEQKQLSKAISAWQRAVEVSPDSEIAHYRLAQAYRQAGDSSKAHSELQKYEELSKQKSQEIDRQRHEVKQFVYELRDAGPGPQAK